jgi:hypothetical protein
MDGLERYLVYGMGMWMLWKSARSTVWVVVGTRRAEWDCGWLGKVPHVRSGHTIGKWHSFISGFLFIGTDEYIQIIFVSFETNEYNFIFVGWVQELMTIWVIRFDLDWPHIFVGDMEYMHRRATV